jgi:hypothetical protein
MRAVLMNSSAGGLSVRFFNVKDCHRPDRTIALQTRGATCGLVRETIA